MIKGLARSCSDSCGACFGASYKSAKPARHIGRARLCGMHASTPGRILAVAPHFAGATSGNGARSRSRHEQGAQLISSDPSGPRELADGPS